jgi:hypothetical protein
MKENENNTELFYSQILGKHQLIFFVETTQQI